MQKRIKLIAGAECLIFRRITASGRFFLNGMQLDSLLHFFDSAGEISGGLREFLVISGFSGMDEDETCIVVFIFPFHFFDLLPVMFGAVIVYVISCGECLPVAGGGGILFCSASRKEDTNDADDEDHRRSDPFAICRP